MRSSRPTKFVDFCAGIGAGRLALERNGLECQGFAEINELSERTYRKLFGEDEENFGDLMLINTSDLPSFDLLIAGFPCQSFSIVGLRKGMLDHRGQIIYGLVRILQDKNVPYFILENVKGLVNHEGGATLGRILELLNEANYEVWHCVLNSIDYGVPQLRERVYFVGVRRDLVPTSKKFEWPAKISTPELKSFLSANNSYALDRSSRLFETFLSYLSNKYNVNKFDLREILDEDYLVLDTRQSDLRLYRNKVPTLRTGRHGILYVKNGVLYRLSPEESFRLQGFPDFITSRLEGCNSDTALLSQAGNAMTVNVIEALHYSLEKFLTHD